MDINLSTHTVYPEIVSDHDSGQWIAKLITRKGKIAESFKGEINPLKGDSITDVIAFRKEVTKAVESKFNGIIKNYVKGDK